MPDAANPQKEVVLSGIRATGTLHIGNYLGAIRFFAELAKDPGNRCLFFVADLHSLTTPNEDTKHMATQMREIIRWYLAAGIDPTEHIIFTQSSVPATTELNWLLSCVTPMGDLERMPHWKEKSESEKSKGHLANAGLFTYPILMAADILGPGATLVPVGEDQHAHVELARELAYRFNQLVGEELFPIPQLMDQSIRVPGLKGSGKMGKSEPKGTINLTDSSDGIRKKCLGAEKKLPPRADNPHPVEPRTGSDPGSPELCRVFLLHAIASSKAEEEIRIQVGCRNGTLSCGDCKLALHTQLMSLLEPIQERYRDIVRLGDDYIDDILTDGGSRARDLINPRIIRAKELMGLRSY